MCSALLCGVAQGGARPIMILKPLWKSLGWMFPVGQTDVKISVRPSLTGREAVNSNN